MGWPLKQAISNSKLKISIENDSKILIRKPWLENAHKIHKQM